jgi:hypothetical protein
MSNLNLTKIYIALVAMLLTAAAFFGCSEQTSIMNTEGSPQFTHFTGDDNPVEVIVTNSRYGGYFITVKNNTQDTLNDFHIQLQDSTYEIKDPNTLNSGWQKSYGGQHRNDSSKVDLKTTRGTLSYNPIKPGKQLQLLWFWLRSNKESTDMKFDWQATKDGEVVASGTVTLP